MVYGFGGRSKTHRRFPEKLPLQLGLSEGGGQGHAGLDVVQVGHLHGGVDVPGGHRDAAGVYAGAALMDGAGVGATEAEDVTLVRNIPC